MGRDGEIPVDGRQASTRQGWKAREEDGDIARGEEDFDEVFPGGEGGEGPGAEEKIGAKSRPPKFCHANCDLKEEGGRRGRRKGSHVNKRVTIKGEGCE